MNMPDVNKKAVNSLLQLETVAKLNKLAKSLGISVGALQETILHNELSKRVQLDPEDYVWIASEVEKNKARRNNKPTKKETK